MSRAGDPVRLGVDVGGGQEPGRHARLVGIRKAETWDNGKAFGRYVIRVYRPDDGDFPTGELLVTGFLWPTDWSTA